MFLRSSSLRLKLLLLFLTVVIFPMLLATAFSFLSQKEQINRSLQRELNASLGACRLYYENLQERLKILTLAASIDSTCKTTLRLGVLPQLQKQVAQLALKYNMDFLLVTDTDGNVVAAYPTTDNEKFNLSSHTFVNHALKGKMKTATFLEKHPFLTSQLSSTDPPGLQQSEVLFIESAMPIKIRKTIIGSIISGIKLSNNLDIMLDMKKASNTDRTILMMEKKIVASSCQAEEFCQRNKICYKKNPLLQVVYGDMRENDNSLLLKPFSVINSLDKKQLAFKWYFIHGMEDQPVAALATLIDYDKAVKLINAAILRIVAVFLLGMVLAAILSFFVSRSIAAPIKSLSNAMEELQKGLIVRPISEERGDEIGTLAKGFNVMQNKLQSQLKALQKEIEERERAEMLLADEKERLAITLRSIGDGVITTDIEGRILFINTIAEQLTGWTNDEAQGKPSAEIFNIIDEKNGKKVPSPITKVLEAGKIITLASDTALITKDGFHISIADSGAPIRDRENNIIGVVLVFRDVTFEKKMEEELLKAKKLESVGILAGGIAHDFNNILSAILGNIELANFLIENDSKAYSLLSKAQKATKRASKLTQQLLTFSKGGNPIKETTSLPKLIIESADFVLHGSKVSCDYSFQEGLWMVKVDSGQIGQVIQNIILNARHAMPKGGKIKIECKNIYDSDSLSSLHTDKREFVCIKIQDKGTGIPQEIIGKIFDPYFTTKKTGSGLGLAISYSIIKKHNGHISVKSIQNQGTTFKIYLPAHFSADKIEKSKMTTETSIKSARIIVMDDEEMIRSLVKEQLSSLGHEAFLVEDGDKAIKKYQELLEKGSVADLVIMDLTIPGAMGGQEAARQLLKVDPKAKIIVSSGYSNDPVMSNYREYGFIAAVNKPFDLAEIKNVLESTLSHSTKTD